MNPAAVASIIVPAYEAEASLGPCIESLLMSRRAASIEESCEIIVVVDRSEDRTAEIAESYPVKVLRLERREGPARARNAGAKASSGRRLFFIDADCRADRGWIAAGLEALAEPGAVAAEGEVFYERRPFELYYKAPINPFYNWKRKGRLSVAGKDFAASNLAVDRETFEKIGGFDAEGFPSGREDTDLGYRMLQHGRIAASSRMIVFHNASEWDASALRESSRRYGADVSFFARHGTFHYKLGPAMHPLFLLLAICPPLFLIYFAPRSWRELRFLPRLYLYLWQLRLSIWKAAVRHRQCVI